MDIKHRISSSINKVKNDWERALQSENGISRIDKDILINDLRALYDLVFELKSAPLKREEPQEIKSARETKPISNPDSQKTNPEEKNKNSHALQNPGEIELEIVDRGTTETPSNNTEAPAEESDGPLNYPEPKQPETEEINNSAVKVQTTTDQSKNHIPASKTQKSNSEKFQASKTLADIYQKNGDNSLAAKMKKNKISDIKAAIGINDKFLFINEIFKSDTKKYNEFIDAVNRLNNYHEAISLLEQIKSNHRIDNQEALVSLTDIIKRKFY